MSELHQRLLLLLKIEHYVFGQIHRVFNQKCSQIVSLLQTTGPQSNITMICSLQIQDICKYLWFVSSGDRFWLR